MNFSWSDYLTVAYELSSMATTSSFQEAKMRSAISRAYYAAFCTARNYLVFKGYVIPPGENVHWRVIDEFSHSTDVTAQEIGRLLRHMKSIRNAVDYETRLRFRGRLLQVTQSVLAEAEDAIYLLGTL